MKDEIRTWLPLLRKRPRSTYHALSAPATKPLLYHPRMIAAARLKGQQKKAQTVPPY